VIHCVYVLLSSLCPSCVSLITDGSFAADRRIRSKERVLTVFAGDDFETAYHKIGTDIVVAACYKNLSSLCFLNRNKDSFFTHILSLLNY
jgi:hypothetical protein